MHLDAPQNATGAKIPQILMKGRGSSGDNKSVRASTPQVHDTPLTLLAACHLDSTEGRVVVLFETPHDPQVSSRHGQSDESSIFNYAVPHIRGVYNEATHRSFTGRPTARNTDKGELYMDGKSNVQNSSTEKPSVTLPGTVEKIIPAPHAEEPEKAQISVEGADHLYREIRIENILEDDNGNKVKLEKGAHVEVTIEANPTETKSPA
jgi:hypothetical protein